MNQITCKGFKASGFHAGLKKNGRRDLGLIYSEHPAQVAAVFTRNRVKAAPVLLSMERVQKGSCRAVIANSGNANCCTGPQGMRDADQMTRAVAASLGIDAADVLAASTGVIGAPLPIDKISRAVPDLVQTLAADGFQNFAEAVMTTDTLPKIVHREGRLQDKPYHLIGIAKGSGMIAPNMATMLCFVCTDAHVPHQVLQDLLRNSVEKTLNRIVIDGDTSTNDVTFLLANGLSGARVDDAPAKAAFQHQLDQVLKGLAKMLVKDGEGVTKCVDIRIQGAPTEQQALTIARTIATSPLVKTALFGEDANWGRLIAAAGRSGVPIEPEIIDIYFDEVRMVQNGMGCGSEAEASATEILKKPEFTIAMDLKSGTAGASILTCDFSLDYVKINADYRS